MVSRSHAPASRDSRAGPATEPTRPFACEETGQHGEQVAGAFILLPGSKLLGQSQNSGLREPPYLVRRPDGQVVQLSRLLYLVAEHARPGRELAELARRAGNEMDLRITPEQVRYLLEQKLHPLGITTAADGTSPRLTRLQPIFGLRHRVGVVPPAAVNRIGSLLSPLFLPPVIACLFGCMVAFDVWLFGVHGIGRGLSHVIERPSLSLLLFALAYASLAFHEAGHAAACRYGGGRPGAIGIGIYIVWPVFYTDVTDSYRFGRPGRLRTDLGGVYFNCVFALGIAAAYIATGFEPLLLAVVAQHLFVLDQFFPWVRLDGYYVVADLLGVSDLFSRIKPVLRSLLPGRRADPRVEQLKPWARAAVSAWVLTTIAAIAGGASLLFASAPRYLQSAWESLGLQADAFRHGVGMLDPVTALSAGIDVVLLALPVAGFLVTYLLLCHGMGSGLALARARAAVHGRTDWTGQGDRPAQAQ